MEHKLLIGFIIFVVFIAVALVVWAIVTSSSRTNATGLALNLVCQLDDQCNTGLTCSGGRCKVQIGGTCSNINECVIGATACKNGTCISTSLGDIGDNCTNDDDCESTLACQNMVCKSKLGNSCENLSDCVKEANVCLNNICAEKEGGLNDPCPCAEGLECHNDICKVPAGNACNIDNDCPLGHICSKNKLDPCRVCMVGPTLGQPCTDLGHCSLGLSCGKSQVLERVNGDDQQRYEFKDLGIVDMFKFCGFFHLLMSNGTIIVDKGNMISTIQNDTKMCRIVNFDGFLLGIDTDKQKLHVMQLDKKRKSKFKWKWVPVSWFNETLIHMDTTNDTKILWLQSPLKSGDTQGWFVTPHGPGKCFEDTIPMKEKILSQGVIRTHGRNDLTYVETDTNSKEATIFPSMFVRKNTEKADLKDSGELVHITTDEKNIGYKEVRVFDERHFIITHRICG